MRRGSDCSTMPARFRSLTFCEAVVAESTFQHDPLFARLGNRGVNVIRRATDQRRQQAGRLLRIDQLIDDGRNRIGRYVGRQLDATRIIDIAAVRWHDRVLETECDSLLTQRLTLDHLKRKDAIADRQAKHQEARKEGQNAAPGNPIIHH